MPDYVFRLGILTFCFSSTLPHRFSRHALESCNLSTKDIPIPQSVEQPVKFPSIKSSTFSRGFPDIENDMSKMCVFQTPRILYYISPLLDMVLVTPKRRNMSLLQPTWFLCCGTLAMMLFRSRKQQRMMMICFANFLRGSSLNFMFTF